MKKNWTTNLADFFESVFDKLEKQTGKKVNLNRQDFICKYMTGMLQSRSVQDKEIASHMDSDAKIASDVRRIERFYSSYSIDFELFSLLLCQCLPKGKLKICMDRTDWKFGNSWHNLLVITVRVAGTGIPIWVEVLDKGQGTSNTKERIDIVKNVLNLVGKNRIHSFLADREFIGKEWIDFLDDNGIDFFIRLRNNQYFEWCGVRYQIKKKLGRSKKELIQSVKMYGGSYHLAIVKGADGKEVAILTNTTAKRALKAYKKRWSIEVFFQNLKSRGFRLETTQRKDSQRIRTLFILASLAYILCFIFGFYRHIKEKRILIKNNGYKENSIARVGLDFIRETIKLDKNVQSIFEVFLKEMTVRWRVFKEYSDFDVQMRKSTVG